jgi:hypothetical protein
MRVANEWVDIDIRQWRSKDELAAFMAIYGERIVVGTSAEQATEFYSVRFEEEAPRAGDLFAVGVYNEGHAVIPQLLLAQVSGFCLFGANSEVVSVNIRTRRLEYQTPLPCFFRAMIPVFERDLVLAIHEIGATAFRASNGREVWSLVRDVVENARRDGDRIRFQFMDSEPVEVDIATGLAMSSFSRQRPERMFHSINRCLSLSVHRFPTLTGLCR